MPSPFDVEELRSRASWYRTFGGLLLSYPPQEWLSRFQSELIPQWNEFGCSFDPQMAQQLTADLQDDLRSEFTSLWVAPGSVPRFESVFETGYIFQDPCDRVSALYRNEGFVFDDTIGGMFPDQAGVELEFIAHLIGRCAEAVARGDKSEADRLDQVFRSFLEQHAGRWIPAMLRCSVMVAQHPFYRELSQLAFGFMVGEIEATLPRKSREHLLSLLTRMPPVADYDADFRKSSGL